MRRECDLSAGESPGIHQLCAISAVTPIQDWTVHKLIKGTTPLTQAHSLNIQTVTLPEFAVPSEIIEPLTADFLNGQNANTLCRLAAVDVTTWKLIQVELSSANSDHTQPKTTSYEVLHVSTADIDSR